jgi:hypothetical protein
MSRSSPGRVARQYAIEWFGFQQADIGDITDQGDYYSVWIWDLPSRPGFFVIVDVSKDGRVVGSHPGR